MRDVLVTGGSGQVGGALLALPPEPGFRFVGLGRDALNLLKPETFAGVLASRPWAAIINAAAYTAVDKAETDVEYAWRINALAPACLAREAALAGIPLVHVSTDYVFDGASRRPYGENDPVAPLGVYGASKEAGEQGVRTGGGRSVIVRTSWVVSSSRANFLKTMLRLGAERDMLRVVADQYGAPTSATDLATALAHIARALASKAEAPTGTFHFSNAGATTWADFATEIFRLSAARGGPSAGVEPITTADFPTPARRPAYSLLSTDRIKAVYGVSPRNWQDAISDIIDELIPSRTP
jgi:dTDP-4-dehydrorhamnose reductase